MSATLDDAITGTATRQPSSAEDVTSSTNASRASLSVSTWPSSSMSVMCSPSGSMTAPTWAPEVRTRGATSAADTSRSKEEAPGVEAYGLTARMSVPSLASTLGITNAVEPYA
jgi:hypothetical protein